MLELEIKWKSGHRKSICSLCTAKSVCYHPRLVGQMHRRNERVKRRGEARERGDGRGGVGEGQKTKVVLGRGLIQ